MVGVLFGCVFERVEWSYEAVTLGCMWCLVPIFMIGCRSRRQDVVGWCVENSTFGQLWCTVSQVVGISNIPIPVRAFLIASIEAKLQSLKNNMAVRFVLTRPPAVH